MKLVVQTQLLPDDGQDQSLKAIVERFNEARNWVAVACFARRETNQFEVRKFAYREVRDRFGLSSQMAQLAIKNVCDAYKRDKTICPVFDPHAAIVYDQRVMSFKGIDRVSLLTLEGRVVVPFILGSYFDKRFKLPRGQADLILRDDGKWFLLVTVDVPDGTEIPATDFIGIDLGIINIATDSDGGQMSARRLTRRDASTATGAKRSRRPPPSVGSRADALGRSAARLSRTRPGRPATNATSIIAHRKSTSIPPSAPGVGSLSRTSRGSANGLRLGAGTHGIGCTAGPSSSSGRSCRTRHNSRASRSSSSIRPTRRKIVPSADIETPGIARLKRRFGVCPAATPITPIETRPGTSGPGPSS